MKLTATVNGKQADIQLEDAGARVIAQIDDQRYELDVHETGAQSFLIISDGRVFDCRIDGRPESGTVAVVIGATPYEVTIVDPKRLRSAASLGTHADGAARIVAPMPGKIVRLLVGLGDQVAAGAGIAVVEAMKMQNEMKSPKAGTVVTLNVEIGATVNGGDVLAVIE